MVVLALHIHYKISILTLTSSNATIRHFTRKCALSDTISVPNTFKQHLENMCSYCGGCAMAVTLQGYFWCILGTHKHMGIHACKKVVVVEPPLWLQRFPMRFER